MSFQNLRIEMEAYDKDGGESRYAQYSTFEVGNEASNYILNIGG